MRKQRSVLLFVLILFFVLLILDAKISEKSSIECDQKKEEKKIKQKINKQSLNIFEKEFATYWWTDYKLIKKYEEDELDIYLPNNESSNKFVDINDVVTAVALRQYQYRDKKLKVLILSNKKKKLVLLKNGEIIKKFSSALQPKLIDTRLEEWKKANSKNESQQ